MSLPLTDIVKLLEEPTSVVPILKALSLPLNSLSGQKSTVNHIVSRTVNLISSHKPYHKWCGVLVVHVLVKNYEVLSGNGAKFASALLKVLETTNRNTNAKLFSATVECLNSLCDEIRGKPTLTREILTPKLPVIIQSYLNNLDMNPTLIIRSLCHILSHHPTTFRPFGNKLNARLVEYITSPDFSSFPESLKEEIAHGFALLPIIERNEPETFWANKLTGVINEIVDTISIFKDLLDFSQDNEVSSLISNPAFKLESQMRLFEYLQIDISEPHTLLQISDRVEVLMHLLKGFSTTDLKMCVKFPIGKIVSVLELAFSLNTRFLSFKRDLRDESVKSMINAVIRNIQVSALSVISVLCKSFNVSITPYLSGILSHLETTIPISHKALDTKNILDNEAFMVQLLATTTDLLLLVDLYQEPQQLVRFVDVALLLLEPRSTSPDSNGSKPAADQSKTKKPKKKNTQAVPMADLLSHGHLFTAETPVSTTKAARKFINAVIVRMELPSTQYYKIMRYIIIEAVKSTNSNYNRNIPSELKNLLINAVIHPGLEKISILPIVSTILGDDPLISVFNNPRFPPIPKLIKSTSDIDESDDEEPEVQNTADTVTEPTVLSQIIKKRAFESTETSEVSDKRVKTDDEIAPVVELEDQSVSQPVEEANQNILQFKQEDPVVVQQNEEQSQKEEVAPTPAVVPEPAAASLMPQQLSSNQPQGDGNESDFEMPSIDIDDDSDDE